MTTTFNLTVRLTSDAEPGTGFGTEGIDDIVPRDHCGLPCIPASHVKGVVRGAFGELSAIRGWPDWLETALFGSAGADASVAATPQRCAGREPGGPRGHGEPGSARFTAWRIESGAHGRPPVSVVSRTAIGDAGTVRPGSLRTVERINVGSTFRGSVTLDAPSESVEADAMCLALLATVAVGGNRNRGSGRCALTIDGVTTRPSILLRRIDERVREAAPGRLIRNVERATRNPVAAAIVLAELTFVASDPVCCPTVPLTGTNVIRSGFSIPASAVQGALLHRINALDPGFASACYAHPEFRAWPLLPCALATNVPSGVLPIWTSLTHRMSKLAAREGAEPEFRDAMIEPYDWRSVPSGAPLKASDGVLLASPDGVTLWKAADMPRHVSAHVGLGGTVPELFTVEAMAPMTYRGLVSMPADAFERCCSSIAKDPYVSFGRSKTVRGGGTLAIRQVDADTASVARGDERVFIVQSPIAIPAGGPIGEAGMALGRLVEASGWGSVSGAQATIELRFGWNTSGLGGRVGDTNRMSAVRVIAPGSVFKLVEPAADVRERLVRGIGAMRERGFGAVLPHPASRRLGSCLFRMSRDFEAAMGQRSRFMSC